MDRATIQKYLPLALLILLVGTSILIVRSYVVALLSAFVFAFLLRPIHIQLTKTFKPSIAAVICTFALLLVLMLPFIFVIGGAINQLQSLFSTADTTTYIATIQNFLARLGITYGLTDITQRVAQYFIQTIAALTLRLPATILAIFITLMGVYYMLLGWETLTKKLSQFLPAHQRSPLPKELASVTRSLVYGTLLIAIIEFVVAALGFAIAGVKAYLFLAFLIALFAFIPALGPAIVWIPTFIILIIQGDYFASVIVAITGLIISIYVDTLLRIQMGGKSSRIHPLIMLVGIFGGVVVFGIWGFVIGPLLLAYTLKLIEKSVDDS